MCCIARNCKRSLILCVNIVLTRLCYVLLLSGKKNVLIVQPFLQKNVVCSSHEKTPLQTTLSLASETFLKKSYLCWYFLAPFSVLPLKLHLHSL
jgi:hypothetical protein